jgi:hypothetical protein
VGLHWYNSIKLLGLIEIGLISTTLKKRGKESKSFKHVPWFLFQRPIFLNLGIWSLVMLATSA